MKPINILLVEDDLVDIMDIKRSLDKLNILYQLETARNGEEAIEMLNIKYDAPSKPLPDVLLLDINMPKMNGLELLEVIRNTEKWRDLKCFIITTSSEEVDRKEARKLNVSGYIIKPLKLNMSSTMDALNLMIDLMNFKSLN